MKQLKSYAAAIEEIKTSFLPFQNNSESAFRIMENPFLYSDSEYDENLVDPFIKKMRCERKQRK